MRSYAEVVRVAEGVEEIVIRRGVQKIVIQMLRI